MADPNDTRGAPPREIHIGKKKCTNWLAWIALLAGILALLFALSRCGRDDASAVTTVASTNTTDVVAATPNAGSATALAGTSGLGGYLAGTEAAPRTFQFEKLTFDTAKSTLRPDDAKEVGTIAAVLKQYGNTHVRIAGYADARGSDAANAALGKARADAVKAGLVAQGIAADRIETVSGGESDPVGTNATASGQAENRRTELVVTSR
ncbi:MAG: OmpA family protein [Sphingomonas sp.]|nr:MAG: OmpA family protein [Sphingomonas sp.]